MERWKRVLGYPSYEVSDLGRVRSIGAQRRKGQPGRVHSGRVLVQTRMTNGYFCVALCHAGKQKTAMVHILVLTAFAGSRPAGAQARHYPDPNKANNRLDNLSWATPQANQHDRLEHGTDSRGLKNPNVKLTLEQIRNIRARKDWPRGTLTRLAREYGVSIGLIWHVKNERAWKYV